MIRKNVMSDNQTIKMLTDVIASQQAEISMLKTRNGVKDNEINELQQKLQSRGDHGVFINLLNDIKYKLYSDVIDKKEVKKILDTVDMFLIHDALYQRYISNGRYQYKYKGAWGVKLWQIKKQESFTKIK